GAGDGGGAVLVLAAGIDQEEFAWLDRAVGPAGDAVMHNGAVRAGARDGGKRDFLEQAALAAEGLQRFNRADLGELAARRLSVEPGEETGNRDAVALVSVAGAFDLHRIFHRLHESDWVGAARRLAASRGDEPSERVGGGRLVEPNGLVRAAQRGQVMRKVAGIVHVGERFELAA